MSHFVSFFLIFVSKVKFFHAAFGPVKNFPTALSWFVIFKIINSINLLKNNDIIENINYLSKSHCDIFSILFVHKSFDIHHVLANVLNRWWHGDKIMKIVNTWILFISCEVTKFQYFVVSKGTKPQKATKAF